MMKWDCYVNSKKSGISVISQLSAANQKEILSNREYIKCLIDIVLYHSRQGLALRAHREDVNSTNRGNCIYCYINIEIEIVIFKYNILVLLKIKL